MQETDKGVFPKTPITTTFFSYSGEIEEGVSQIESTEADYLATVDWINQHGSRQLKTMLSEGIKCRERYRAERWPQIDLDGVVRPHHWQAG